MKKSMLTLVGCALAAGTVMAAEVAGNNTAVVIQKDAVVSDNLYQFLIVPVKGFDITGGGNAETLTLDEILPPAAFPTGTMVYKAENNPTTYYVRSIDEVKKWTAAADSETAVGHEVAYGVNTVLWLKAPSVAIGTDFATLAEYLDTIPDTVFCGELSSDTMSVTPSAGLTPFGNATSTAKTLSELDVIGDAQNGDAIYVIQSGSSEYARYLYNGVWKKKDPSGGWQMVDASDDVIPAGAAAYYKR